MNIKIFIGFILTPIISLIIFATILKLEENNLESINVLSVTAFISGLLTTTILYIIILRGKKLFIEEEHLKVVKIFKKEIISKKNLKSIAIDNRSEGKWPFRNNYEIIQLTTEQDKTYHFLDYELKNYQELKNWILSKRVKKSKLVIFKFLSEEYLLPSFLGVLTTLVIIVIYSN